MYIPMAPFRRIKSPVEARIDGGRVHVVAMKEISLQMLVQQPKQKYTRYPEGKKRGGVQRSKWLAEPDKNSVRVTLSNHPLIDGQTVSRTERAENA